MRLLEVLLQQCTYPEEYGGSWDDIDAPGVDEEVFKELRGDIPGVSGTGDVLIICSSVLKQNFIISLLPRLQHRGADGILTWNIVESALFALEAVSGSSEGGGMSSALAPIQGIGNGSSQTFLRQIQTRELLLSVLEFLTLSSDETIRKHPLLLNAGSGMIGAYASLLRLEALPLHTLGYEQSTDKIQEAAAAAAAAEAATNGSSVAKVAPALLRPALEYIGTALAEPLATKAAARAFRLICVDPIVSMQMCMLSAQTGGEAFSAFLVASVQAGGTQDDRTKIVEGATRIISQMVSSPHMRQSLSSRGTDAVAAAGEAALRFATPMLLKTLSTAVEAGSTTPPGSNSGPRCESIAEALGLLGTMLTFLDVPSATVNTHPSTVTQHGNSVATVHHIATPLITALMPILEALLRSSHFGQDDEVASGVFTVFGRAFKNLPTIMREHLTAMVQTIVEVFEKYHFPAALDCVFDSVNAFGGTAGSDVAFRSLLEHLTQQTVAYLHSVGHGPTEEPALVQSFFNMLKGYTIFSPVALLQGSYETVSLLFNVAVACVECVKERDSLRSVLLFLTAFVKLKGKAEIADAYNNVVFPLVVSEQGQRLTCALLGALAGGTAANVHDAIAECTTTILSTLTLEGSSPVQGWVASVLSENQKCRELDDAYRHRFLNAVTYFGSGRHVLPRAPGGTIPRNPKLKIVLLDFGKVCTGNKSVDDCQYDLRDS